MNLPAPLFSGMRQALRAMMRERVHTLTLIGTFALCIAANVAIFSVVRGVLLKPLPFRNSEQLVVFHNSYPKLGSTDVSSSIANYYIYKEQLGSLSDLAATQAPESAISGEAGQPAPVLLQKATPSFFSTLGVQASIGRLYTEEENEYGKSNVVLLSHAFWRSQYQGDPGVIGRTIRVDHNTCTIVGVLPENFRYLSRQAQLVMPLPSSPRDRAPERRHSNLRYQIIGRLKPGVTVQRMQAEMDALDRNLLEKDPLAQLVKDCGYHTVVRGLHEDTVRGVSRSLLLLQSGALFLLLIGAVNLTNLLLVKALSRKKEFAVKTALGAGRSVLALQILTENLLTAFIGGLCGLLLGSLALGAIEQLGASQLPLASEISMDLQVAAVGLLGSLLAGLLLSLPVLWFSLRGGIATGLSSASRGSTGSRTIQRFKQSLIVLQVALAFVLLSGTGLLVLSLHKVLQTPPGFNGAQLCTARYRLPWASYKEDGRRQDFAKRVLEHLRSAPGVENAAISDSLPLSDYCSTDSMTMVGYHGQPGEPHPNHWVYIVTGDFLETMGMHLLEGRPLNAADMEGENRYCLVDETVAKRYWPGESALGHQLFRGIEKPNEGQRVYTIVGVVRSTKQSSLTEEKPRGTVYLPMTAERGSFSAFVLLRSVLPAETLFATMRQAVLKADPEIPLDDPRPMAMRIEDTVTERRTPALLAGVFSALALLLAALGVYGALAYAVSQRRREIGVRMALGALPTQVLGHFVSQGALLLFLGLFLGLGGAWLAGQAMGSLLYAVSATHLGILGIAGGALACAVLAATWIPSWRAARLNPQEALRSD